MKLTVRKFGNSVGIIFPAYLLRAMHLAVGNTLIAKQVNGKLILTPTFKPKYTLAELLAKCNPHAPIPNDVQDWDASPARGREVL